MASRASSEVCSPFGVGAMTKENYHRSRAKQCLMMAEQAGDAGIRQRHEQLAELHARRSAELERKERALAD